MKNAASIATNTTTHATRATISQRPVSTVSLAFGADTGLGLFVFFADMASISSHTSSQTQIDIQEPYGDMIPDASSRKRYESA